VRGRTPPSRRSPARTSADGRVPAEAVRWLVGEEPCGVVDLGAGTGKLTRVGRARPSRRGRRAAGQRCAVSSSRAVPGRSRSAGAPRRSARGWSRGRCDVGTGLPLVRPRAGAAEIARVLAAGRSLALVWNSRDDRDPWMARLSAIIGNETVQESDVVPVLDASGLFGRSSPPGSRSSRRTTATGSSTSCSRELPARSSSPSSASRPRCRGAAVRPDGRAWRRAPRLRHGLLPRRAALAVRAGRPSRALTTPAPETSPRAIRLGARRLHRRPRHRSRGTCAR
jgi:hypothetical protein